MGEPLEEKKKKGKKDKRNQILNSDDAEPYAFKMQQISQQTAQGERIAELEERVKMLETRFKLMEDLVPKELRNLSNRLTTIGQWVGYDKGEK